MSEGKGTVSARDLLGGERDMFEIIESQVMDIASSPPYRSAWKDKPGCYCSVYGEKGEREAKKTEGGK